MAHPITPAEFAARVEARYPGRFDILHYSRSRLPARVRCRACSTEFSIRSESLMKTGCCPSCNGSAASWHSKALDKARDRAKSPLVSAEGAVLGKDGRRLYKFRCSKHGDFSVKVLGMEARCPRCHRYINMTHPDRIPKARRGTPCDLYLLDIQDTTGRWFKLGISTNLPKRKQLYKRQGVDVLRTLRVFKTTLYRAACIELELKRWARRTLGKRVKPRKSWSGWSESFKDPLGRLPVAFEHFIGLDSKRDL